MEEKEKMKKKRIAGKRTCICFLLFTLFATLAGMGRMDQKAGAAISEKKQIANAVKKKLPKKHKVKKVFYLDFDKNGRKEAFILTGKPIRRGQSKLADGRNTLWFGWKEDGAVHIQKVKKYINITMHTLKLKSASFLCAGPIGTHTFPEDLYQVDGNQVSVIFSGDTIRKLSGNDFTSGHYNYYDSYIDYNGGLMGPTWKTYYFYYENGSVFEYEAEQISKEQLEEKYSNASSVLGKMKKKESIVSILHRSNGLIHVNIRKDYGDGVVSFRYVTYQVQEGKLVKLEGSNGNYRAKLSEEGLNPWESTPGRMDQKAGAAISEKKQIANAVQKKLPKKHKVKKVFYLDYDKNGRKEAFVLTGKPVKGKYRLMEDGMNTLWFGWKEDGEVHIRKIKKDISITAHTLKLDSASFLCAGGLCPTSFPEDLYQVDGNRVSVIFSGDWIKKLSGDDFTSVDSAYDSVQYTFDDGTKVWAGHTWKPYYFYYENGKVQEYGAEQISEEDLRNHYSNATSVLKKNKKKGKIASILLRSNGLLHINYREEDPKRRGDLHYWYVTYQVKEGKLVKLGEDDGNYMEKLTDL